MDVRDAVRRRRTTEYFEPDGLLLTRDEIETLISDACMSPSEFNLQPWRFVIVRDQERKERLYECTSNQEKVRGAAAVIIVCGDTKAFENAPDDLRTWYESRDRERMMMAIRNPSFSGMTLMLLALERGIASAAIFGFSDRELRRVFHIGERYLPVMLIALGLPSTGRQQPPRAERVDIKDLVFHEDMAGLGF